MGSLLNTLFVILINIIGWSLLIAGIVGFLYVAYRLAFCTGKNGSLPWL